MNLIYIGVVRPFKVPRLNKLELYNEVFVNFLGIVLTCFTDLVKDPQAKYGASWLFIGLVVINIGSNVVFVIIWTI